MATTLDASHVVSGSRDGTAVIWTPDRGTHVLPHNEWVRGVAITGEHVVTTNKDGVVRIWRLADGTLVAELTGHRAATRDVDVSQDGTVAVTGSLDRTACVWELRRSRLRHQLWHDSGVRSVRITPDGAYALSTSDDRTAWVWDLTTGAELHRVVTAHRIACCAIDPLDTTRFVLGTSNGETLGVEAG